MLIDRSVRMFDSRVNAGWTVRWVWWRRFRATSRATAEKYYRLEPLDLLRVWQVKIEGWILEQAGIVPPVESEATTLRAVK